jgi:hypothetical protein
MSEPKRLRLPQLVYFRKSRPSMASGLNRDLLRLLEAYIASLPADVQKNRVMVTIEAGRLTNYELRTHQPNIYWPTNEKSLAMLRAMLRSAQD